MSSATRCDTRQTGAVFAATRLLATGDRMMGGLDRKSQVVLARAAHPDNPNRRQLRGGMGLWSCRYPLARCARLSLANRHGRASHPIDSSICTGGRTRLEGLPSTAPLRAVGGQAGAAADRRDLSRVALRFHFVGWLLLGRQPSRKHGSLQRNSHPVRDCAAGYVLRAAVCGRPFLVTARQMRF